MVILGGLFGAFFAALGLAALLGPDLGYGGDAAGLCGMAAILGLMVCGAGLLFSLFHPTRGLPSIAVGGLIGLGVFLLVAGPVLRTAWSAPLDRPSGIRAVGSWTSGDLVVRARPDQVVAYRGATGEVVWRWSPPGEDSVCAMSRESGHGLGLIGHAGLNQPCAGVVALDLSTGASRWTAQLDAPARTGDAATDGLLAIAGDRAVLQENAGWRAVNLADGTAAWRSDADPGCSPLRVAGSPTAVVTVAQCGTGGPLLRSLTASDGRERTRAVLPMANGLNAVAVLATDPLTVWADEKGDRGTHAVLSFDGAGRLRSSIPVSGAEYDLDITLGTPSLSFPKFTARPSYGAVVVGDLLIAPGEKPGDVTYSTGKNHAVTRNAIGHLVAYSLADGGKKWTVALEDQVTGIALDADGTGVWALTRMKLTRIEAATGHPATSLDINFVKSENPVDLSVSGPNRFTLVAPDGAGDEPPARGLH